MTERMRKPEVALLLVAAVGGTLAIASVAKVAWRPATLRFAPLPTGPLVLPIPCGFVEAQPEPKEAR